MTSPLAGTPSDPHPSLLEEHSAAILVLDDHHLSLEIEIRYLSGVGFHVFGAQNLQQMMDIVAQNALDLVILDADFGKGQGLSAIAQARHRSRNPNVKFLVTSVMSGQEIRKKAETSGASAFLVKPAPRPKILREIKKLVSQKVRDSERIKTPIQVRATCSLFRSLPLSTLDLSADGTHLKWENESNKPPVGTPIDLEMILGDSRPVICRGEVVRHTQAGIGVRFLDMSQLHRRNLDKFLLVHSMEARATAYYL